MAPRHDVSRAAAHAPHHAKPKHAPSAPETEVDENVSDTEAAEKARTAKHAASKKRNAKKGTSAKDAPSAKDEPFAERDSSDGDGLLADNAPVGQSASEGQDGEVASEAEGTASDAQAPAGFVPVAHRLRMSSATKSILAGNSAPTVGAALDSIRKGGREGMFDRIVDSCADDARAGSHYSVRGVFRSISAEKSKGGNEAGFKAAKRHISEELSRMKATLPGGRKKK